MVITYLFMIYIFYDSIFLISFMFQYMKIYSSCHIQAIYIVDQKYQYEDAFN